MIEKGGRGAGSGVLVDASTVVTAGHVVAGLEFIWVFVPQLERSIKAEALRVSTEPDIAVLRLEQNVGDNISALAIDPFVPKGELVRLVGFALGEKDRLGVVNGRADGTARLAKDKQAQTYLTAQLERWAFSGDSGGGIYTCEGALAGIQKANSAGAGKPDYIFIVPGDVVNAALGREPVPVKGPSIRSLEKVLPPLPGQKK